MGQHGALFPVYPSEYSLDRNLQGKIINVGSLHNCLTVLVYALVVYTFCMPHHIC